MTLLSWVMSKRYICKSKFHVCYHFFRYEKPRRKTFLTRPVQRIVKQLIEIKYDIIVIFTLRSGASERHQKEAWQQKIYVILALIPVGWQGLRLWFAELLTYTISIPLTIEMHKNNIDTFRVTNTTYFFQKKFTRQYFFLSQMWTYILNHCWLG